MATGYQRVSRRAPCRICGKPDWCSTTKDHNIAFCARSATNADRLSSKGWGIFYYDSRSPFPVGRTQPKKKLKRLKSPSVAPIEIRHRSYQSLIKLSPLPASGELIYGNEWLFRQGQEFGRCGILPKLATRKASSSSIAYRVTRKRRRSYSRFQRCSRILARTEWKTTTG